MLGKSAANMSGPSRSKFSSSGAGQGLVLALAVSLIRRAILFAIFVLAAISLLWGIKGLLREAPATEGTEEGSTVGTSATGAARSPLRVLQTEETSLLDDLKHRQAALDKKEKALQLKEEDLKALQAEVDQKVGQLTRLREELKDLLAEKKAREEATLVHLVKLYEAMRAEEAAAVLSKMDDQIAVALLTRMNSKKAGKILALVPIPRANELTEKLVKR